MPDLLPCGHTTDAQYFRRSKGGGCFSCSLCDKLEPKTDNDRTDVTSVAIHYENIIREAKKTWKNHPEFNVESADELIRHLMPIMGDMARSVRDRERRDDFEAEIGNLLLSLPRWIYEMGVDINLCLELARSRQERFILQRESS